MIDLSADRFGRAAHGAHTLDVITGNHLPYSAFVL